MSVAADITIAGLVVTPFTPRVLPCPSIEEVSPVYEGVSTVGELMSYLLDLLNIAFG